MSRKMNWEKATLAGKRKRSIKEEAEFDERDRAARYLNAVDQRRKQRQDPVNESPRRLYVKLRQETGGDSHRLVLLRSQAFFKCQWRDPRSN